MSCPGAKRSLLISLRSLALTGALFVAAPFGAVQAAEPGVCSAEATPDARLAAAVAKADRPSDHPARDAVRATEMRFVLGHITPGMKVLDVGAGGGYATYILSAAVCDGSVTMQNPPKWADTYGLKAPMQTASEKRGNISSLIADFTAIADTATGFDAIFIGTVYHDAYNMASPEAVAPALYAALVPGGIVVLTDHNTVAGAGITQTDTLHRIEKARVIADFTAAGFTLVTDSDVLANPDDTHTLNVFDPAIRGHTDHMALVFRKPAA